MSKPLGEQGDIQKVEQMENNYRDIYDLLRHALHISESLTVAAETFKILHAEAENQIHKLAATTEPTFEQMSSVRTLRFSSHLASSLKQRASAFVERLNNEATIVSVSVFARIRPDDSKPDRSETSPPHVCSNKPLRGIIKKPRVTISCFSTWGTFLYRLSKHCKTHEVKVLN